MVGLLHMTELTQISRRHHFVSQFYLRAWHDPDGSGFWLYTRTKNGHICLHRRPAKSVAYLENLYSLRPNGLPFGPLATSDEPERTFFSRIDDAAARIHQNLICSDINSVSFDEKWVWSLFLNSLLERSPKRISEIEQAVPSTEIATEFTRRWQSTHMQKVWNKIDINAAVRNSLLAALPAYIVNKPFLDYLAQMCWNTFDISNGTDHFLTGDYPLVVNHGQSDRPIYLLSIALSPKRLLVIHPHAPEFDLEFLRKITVTHNIQVTSQTKTHLVSSKKLNNSSRIRYIQMVEQKLSSVKTL